MKKLKNYFQWLFKNRKINKLVYLLDKDERTNCVTFYCSEKNDSDWIYYYNISGFIGENYFNIYIWKHRKTENSTNEVDLTTDNEIKQQVVDIVLELSGIELKTL